MTRKNTHPAAIPHAPRLVAGAAALVLALSPLPALSQDDSTEGKSLMEQGAELFFEGIRREMSPALDDLRTMAEEMGPALREFVDTMGPALAELLGEVEDLSSYHAPEMLPNGDIILRKKTPETTPETEESPAPLLMQPLDEGEVDL